MVAMRVMKPTVHKVIDMVAMWNGLMPAIGTMNVAGVVPHVTKFRRAAIGVLSVYLDGVLFNHVARLMVQMTVMQVIDMIAVFDRDMAA